MSEKSDDGASGANNQIVSAVDNLQNPSPSTTMASTSNAKAEFKYDEEISKEKEKFDEAKVPPNTVNQSKTTKDVEPSKPRLSAETSKSKLKKNAARLEINLPDINFKQNHQLYMDYFSNKVGPMYGDNTQFTQANHQIQCQTQANQHLQLQNVQGVSNLNNHPMLIQYQNQMNPQHTSMRSPIPSSFYNNMQANYSNAPNPAQQNMIRDQNCTSVNPMVALENVSHNRPFFNMQNSQRHNIAIPQQNANCPPQQNLMNEQNQNILHPIMLPRFDMPNANRMICPPFPTIPNNSYFSGMPFYNNSTEPKTPLQDCQKRITILKNPDRIGVHSNERVMPQMCTDTMNQQYYKNLQAHPLLCHATNSPTKHEVVQNSAKKNKSKPRRKENGKKYTFDKYISAEEVEKGIKNNTLFEGAIRINPKRFDHAYVTVNRDEKDIFIEGIRRRNRALDGDIVIVKIVENINKSSKKVSKDKLNSSNEQKSDSDSNDDEDDDTNKDEENIVEKSKEEQKNHRVGKVVFIKEKIHQRTCTGYLRLMPDNNKLKALFSPRDYRIPRINILATNWPDNFYKKAKEYENVIFIVKITEWFDTRFAMGRIIKSVGQAGDLHAEMIAILSENNLDVTPFAPEMKRFFPDQDYIIPEDEIERREDCRNLCIFSIDPSNCRDIDDAVSCVFLSNGNFEIGVHISDVSHYLEENTILDEIVADRATTVYLVERAFHMLPDELCLLCSLFSGVDKLAFSVFWEITPDGKVLSNRIAKTIIQSCAQLSYEHAQSILDETEVTDFPTIYNGFTLEDIKQVIMILGKLSSIFRTRRFDGGALSINQPKLNFQLDPKSGLPESFHIHSSRPSHQLIEEFMLLANITVAKRLYTDYPNYSFLRCHPEPSKFQLMDLAKQLKALDIDLDITSAATMYKSLLPHIGPNCENKEKAIAISMMCTKPMTRAMYICAAGHGSEDDFKHYALNVPLYTHFTSPIRRYADIMVHRLLSASIDYCKTPLWEIDRIHMIAANCNKQKYNAKVAGEKSTELYTLKYIEMNSPVTTQAVVVDVREKSFDVIVLAMCLNRRIYIENVNDVESSFHPNKLGNKLSKLELVWRSSKEAPETKLTIELFSVVMVELVKSDEIIKIETRLVRPM